MDLDALAKRFAKYEPMLKEMFEGYEKYKAEEVADAAADAAGPAISPELHAEIHAPLHDSDEQIAAKRAHALETSKAETSGEQRPISGDHVALVPDGKQPDPDAVLTEETPPAFDEVVAHDPDAQAKMGGYPEGMKVKAADGPTFKSLCSGNLTAPGASAQQWEIVKPDDGQTGQGQGQDASASGQNQGQGEMGGIDPASRPPEAGQAPPAPSLAEQPPAMEQPPQTGLDRIDDVAEGQAAPVATDEGSTVKPV